VSKHGHGTDSSLVCNSRLSRQDHHHLNVSHANKKRLMSTASAQLGSFKIPVIDNEPMVGNLCSESTLLC
jgi:hypothetical protein